MLKPEHRIFVEAYIFDWNATKAYLKAYPKVKYDTAKVNASKLLTNANIQAYIEEVQRDISKQAGISKLMVLNEHRKLAFNTIAHLHNTWIDRKEFEELTDDQKSCIQEIDTKILKRNIGTKKEPDIVDVEQIKIKLYDKQKSLESISKMLGFNEAEKVDHTITEQVTKFKIPDNGRDEGN